MHRRYRSIARPRHLAGRHGAIALFGMSSGRGEAPICYQRTKMRRATAGARSERAEPWGLHAVGWRTCPDDGQLRSLR
jgi:hypothetical protein